MKNILQNENFKAWWFWGSDVEKTFEYGLKMQGLQKIGHDEKIRSHIVYVKKFWWSRER